MTKGTRITVTLSAAQVAILLQMLERGMVAHPADADSIARALRDAVAKVDRNESRP